MRKVFINKWFILAAFLTLSLSAFSFILYKKTESVCSAGKDCCQNVQPDASQRSEMLWDILSRKLTNFISIL